MRNQMNMVNSYDPSSGIELDPESERLLRRREHVLGSPYRLFYNRPVQISRGDGAFLYDQDGNEYLDAYNNVPVVGHSNARIRMAVTEALDTVNTHTRYLTEPVVAYAERLIGLFDGDVEQAIFTCSGSEAVDLALRVARHVTGKAGIIATRHAYHGTTQATAEISPSLGPNNPIPTEVVLVEAPDLLRDDPLTAAQDFARRVREAIDELRDRNVPLAGMILDSIMSSDGLQGTTGGMIREAVDEVKKSGGLYIADEVQSGFGRTGSHWWGYQHHSVRPDLVALGKPMGNGMPISAVLGRAELLDAFGRDVRYFNTFGGNTVGIAAANAVLDELNDRDLLLHTERLGNRLAHDLTTLGSSDQGVGQVRGSGLFLAVELVTDPETLTPDPNRAARIVNSLREQRILISASGRYDNVLKIRPPLVFGEGHATRLLEGLTVALATTRPSPVR